MAVDGMRNIPQWMVWGLLFAAIVVGASFVIPWKFITWGRVEMAMPQTVTVSGEAKTEQQNQIASYNAGVNEISDNKDQAISAVNSKIAAIIQAARSFGIPEDDIKTQNISVYQMQEQYYEGSRQLQRAGQWQVSNTIDVKLRDVKRAGELADVLTRAGANQLYGPNFQLDDTREAQADLLAEAIENARSKAEKMAAGSGRTLGKVISVSEGGVISAQPMYYARMESGGGGAPAEPGTGTVYSSVTVVFELK